MYASCISLQLIFVMCVLRMGTDGLPIDRRERGVHQDIIAGADFLSVLMESPALRQSYKELSTTELPSITRLSRSTPPIEIYEFSQTANLMDSTQQKSFGDRTSFNSSDDKNSLVPIEAQPSNINFHTVRVPEVTTSRSRNTFPEESSRRFSEPNKNEFEEDEPITFPDYLSEYSDKVDNHDVTQSQSIIFHNNPIQPNNADRSVSYSTVIQALPKRDPLDWNDEVHLQQHGERRERHYDINTASNENKLEKNEFKHKNKQNPSWEKPEQHYASTERNWELPEKEEKPRAVVNQHFPIIYGKPEENYEVDEAVSVMSSGRVHGVQPSPSNKNDNQKVGYVVEGRNYRKYRVEERTSDGFIVGEYGVVSHDDGSLRGVRYTADGTINPRIVYDALMKFLSL